MSGLDRRQMQIRAKLAARKKRDKIPAKPTKKGAPSAPPPKEEEPDEPYSSDTSGSNSDGSDDEGRSGYRKGGYHPVLIGEKYNDRYTIEKKLGWGHFSTVWLTSDSKRPSNHPNKLVALKIQKSASHYSDAAMDEIQILKEIENKQKLDPQGHKFVVRLLDDFVHHGPNGKHVCLVFETMGKNILHYIKKYNYRGMPLKMVKLITKQILAGLIYLHEQCLIIHTDLKPENFLLAPEQPYCLKEVQAERQKLVEERRAALALAAKEQAARDGEAQKKLNKNQKKRVKAKQKKEEEKATQPTDSKTDEPPAVNIILPADTTTATTTATTTSTAPAATPVTAADSAANAVDAAPVDVATTADATPVDAATPATADAAPASSDPTATTTTDQTTTNPAPTKRKVRYTCKIADLGNACWTHKHFTDDITTRQYRSPEVICGYPYDTPVDIFALACMTFELLTGDYLFDPKEDREQRHSRDEDHLALMMELLGKMPRKLATQGKFAREVFDKKGGLRHIQKLDDWGLRNVLIEKYEIAVRHADAISSFLLPCLALDPVKRATAREAYDHPWLADVDIDGEVTDDEVDPLRTYGPEDAAIREEQKKPRSDEEDDDSSSGDSSSGDDSGDEGDDEEEGVADDCFQADGEVAEDEEDGNQLDIPPMDADAEEA